MVLTLSKRSILRTSLRNFCFSLFTTKMQKCDFYLKKMSSENFDNIFMQCIAKTPILDVWQGTKYVPEYSPVLAY